MNLNEYAVEVHRANKKWWLNLSKPCECRDGEDSMGNICKICHGRGYDLLKRNMGEMLCLVHSEISEALEGHRKNLMDDKLPNRRMIEVELADAIIRIFDICAGSGYDLEGAYQEKMAYNAQRADHKLENRLKEGGKAY